MNFSPHSSAKHCLRASTRSSSSEKATQKKPKPSASTRPEEKSSDSSARTTSFAIPISCPRCFGTLTIRMSVEHTPPNTITYVGTNPSLAISRSSGPMIPYAGGWGKLTDKTISTGNPTISTKQDSQKPYRLSVIMDSSSNEISWRKRPSNPKPTSALTPSKTSDASDITPTTSSRTSRSGTRRERACGYTSASATATRAICTLGT